MLVKLFYDAVKCTRGGIDIKSVEDIKAFASHAIQKKTDLSFIIRGCLTSCA